MYRQKRDDTLVGNVETLYGIDFHARRDMRLGTLLSERGFSSQSQIIKAARGQLTHHAAHRNVFLSFHQEDLAQVNGFRLMMKNRHLDLLISDDQSRSPVGSEHSSYIKRALRQRIRDAEVLVCLIGNGTAWREWVDWEIQTAFEEHRGICGVRLKGSRGRAPDFLHQYGSGVSRWEATEMTSMIEKAAAVRS